MILFCLEGDNQNSVLSIPAIFLDQSKYEEILSTQNHILISSSLTALGVSTPDSVMIPEIKLGGYHKISIFVHNSL